MMTDNAANYSSRRKHIREPPSVPFLWEDQPGIAKKDWKPPLPSITIQALPPPDKLIASVPFIWEEKPGKPLPSFSEPTPVTPIFSQWHNKQHFEDYNNNEDGMSNLELQSFSFETNDSFSSARSLSANCLVSTLAISAAVPVIENSLKVDLNGQFESPASPGSETDSSTSSYATGISSLTGSTFLERLFPLHTWNSSFPGDVAFTEESNHYDDDDDDDVARRTVTLGELIMMSRRMSCQRKTVQTATQNLSMEFANKKAFGCCIFGVGIHMLQRLQRKR